MTTASRWSRSSPRKSRRIRSPEIFLWIFLVPERVLLLKLHPLQGHLNPGGYDGGSLEGEAQLPEGFRLAYDGLKLEIQDD